MAAKQAPNRWLGRGVFHWAHQGGAREAPSNTLLAMTMALKVGAEGIELDVQPTRDGRLALLHDNHLERTTNGHGRVADQDMASLQQLDAAYWWVPGEVDNHDPDTPVERYELRGQAPADPELRIPSLDEVLDRFPSTPLTIEVKDKRAVQPLIHLLEQRDRREDVIVTSFKDTIVWRLRWRAPHLPLAPGRAWNVWFFLRTRLRLAPRSSRYVAVQLPLRFPMLKFVKVLDQRLVRAAQRAGMAVHIWTIDDEAEMRDLVNLGVDGIMTDRPSVLAKVLDTARGGPGEGATPA